jgi:hypothetical protein
MALHIDALAATGAARTHVFHAAGAARIAEFAAALRAAGRDTRVQPIQNEIQWASIEALNTAIVPTEAMQQIVTSLSEAA